MDTSTLAVIIAGGALMLNFVDKLWGGGRKLSNRITKLETGVDGIQSEIRKLVEAIGKIADMRGDIRVLDQRILTAEQDIRELRHGDGFVRNRAPSMPRWRGLFISANAGLLQAPPRTDPARGCTPDGAVLRLHPLAGAGPGNV
jgi:hypothetical protein